MTQGERNHVLVLKITNHVQGQVVLQVAIGVSLEVCLKDARVICV